MHRPLFLITAGSVAAVGGLLVASAMPAGAATSVRAETMARTAPCTPVYRSPGGLRRHHGDVHGHDNRSARHNRAGLHQAFGTDVAVGGTLGSAGDFGPVTVTDKRALNPAGWTATVSSTDFVNTAVPADTIPAGDATYVTGAVAQTPTCTVDITTNCQTVTPPATALDTTAVSLTNPAALPVAPITLANGVPATRGTTVGTTGQTVVTESGFDGDNAAMEPRRSP